MLSRTIKLAAGILLFACSAASELVPFEIPSLIYDNLPNGQITFDVIDYNHEETIRTLCSGATPGNGPQVEFPSEAVSSCANAKPRYAIFAARRYS